MVIPATESDISQIVELIKSESKYLRERTSEEIKQLLPNVRVIKENEEVVACGIFEDYAQKIGEIRSLVVNPSCRGKGYGEMIIKELVKLSDPGQQVFVVTSKADFFKKFGFDTFHEERHILFYQKSQTKDEL